MNPLDPFYASYGFGSVYNSFSSVVEPVLPRDMDETSQRYFLSLPEEEQQQILRECKGNMHSMRHCIEDRLKRE